MIKNTFLGLKLLGEMIISPIPTPRLGNFSETGLCVESCSGWMVCVTLDTWRGR